MQPAVLSAWGSLLQVHFHATQDGLTISSIAPSTACRQHNISDTILSAPCLICCMHYEIQVWSQAFITRSNSRALYCSYMFYQPLFSHNIQ